MRRLTGRLFPPPSGDDAIDDELRFHLEERTAELMAKGLSKEQARAEVLNRFGDLRSIKERCLALDRQRNQRLEFTTMFTSAFDDLTLAVRSLTRNKRWSVVVIVTLALGLGATIAVWSVVDRVLLQPLPFEDPDRLVSIWEDDRLTGSVREESSVPDLLDFEQRSQHFSAMAGYALFEGNLIASSSSPATSEAASRVIGAGTADIEPRRVSVAAVNHDLLDVLGTPPLLGRGFLPGEDVPGGAQAALLEEGLWREIFAGDPRILGQAIRLDDQVLTVVGVVPAGLEIPSAGAQVWIPAGFDPEVSPRSRHSVNVVARLAPGATLAMANEDLGSIARDLEAEYSSNANRGASAELVADVLRGDVRPALLILLAAVAVVLLIVCANVANLMLARGTRRASEIALTAALGASQGRILRRFVFESLLLTAAAILVGGLIALQMTSFLMSMAPQSLQSLDRAGLRFNEPRVLFFVALLVGAIALFVALVPTMQVRRLHLVRSLREADGARSGGSRRQFLVRRSLVVAQFAFALPLICGALLLLQSLDNLGRVDKGFRSENVLRLDYQLPASRYPRNFAVYPVWTEVNGFNQSILEAARSLPGVTAAALTSNHPMDAGFTNSFVIVGRESESADMGELKTRMVSPGYFETNGVRLLQGRLFDSRDTTGSTPVLIVNQKTVDRYFDGRPVLGQRVAFWGIEREVVGIVSNEHMHGLGRGAPEAMYASLPQAPQIAGVTLMVHTDGDPRALVAPIRTAVRELDPLVAVYNVTTMAETVRDSLARERFSSLVLALFAAVALLLAAVGIYSISSYMVALRRREVGIRLAIGATRSSVVRALMSEGLALALVGVVLGLLGAFALTGWLESLLYGVEAIHGATYLVTAAILLGVGVLGCLLPARRAARVDPVEVLGAE